MLGAEPPLMDQETIVDILICIAMRIATAVESGQPQRVVSGLGPSSSQVLYIQTFRKGKVLEATETLFPRPKSSVPHPFRIMQREPGPPTDFVRLFMLDSELKGHPWPVSGISIGDPEGHPHD